MSTFGKTLTAAIGAAALGLAFMASPAAADPTELRPLAGVGSDTTQDVMNGLGSVITSGGSKVIGSYNAVGSATITTRATGCTFTRPNGSGDGRTALRASEGENGGIYKTVNVTGCIDFARSSSYSATTPGTTGTLTYIPYGVDAVSYAISNASDLPDSLTFVQLQRIYRCLTTTIGGNAVNPLLMQSGSGTRQFWLQKMVITENDIAAGDFPCLDTRNNTIEEHDGRVLDGFPNAIVPFSIGQYVAQTNSATIAAQTGVTVTDRRGTAVLGAVNGIAPTTGGKLNVNFRPELVRDVYNVVPTAKLGNASIASTFVGAGSAVCQNQNTIALFGFGFRATAGATLFQGACGDVALKASA